MPVRPPEQRARWLYALEDEWQKFTDEDDSALEGRWAQLEKEGLIEKRKEELKEEEKEQEEQEERQEKARMDADRQSETHKANASASDPISGVDQIRKSMMESIGKGDEIKNEQAKQGKTVVNEVLQPDQPEEERKFRVPVMEDMLFEVDIGTMKLFPVFWKGVLLKVVRATWFYASDSGHAPIPYDEELSKDLDVAYEKSKVWETSKPSTSATNSVQKDEQEERFPLPSIDNRGEVQFADSLSGRIFSRDLAGRFMYVLGGSIVIRGWDETARRFENNNKTSRSFLPWAAGEERKEGSDSDGGTSKRAQGKEGAAKAPKKAPADSHSSGEGSGDGEGGLFRLWPSSDGLLRPGVNLLRSLGWGREEANEEGQRAAKQKNTEKSLKSEGNDKETEAKTECDSLVFCIHGIGQKMAEEWDAIDFVYDVEKLRNLSKTMASNEAMHEVSQGKRAQYLPICWRRDLDFDEEPIMEGNDNRYTLEDVSNNASIPIVRNVISKVILDVPYYLSRHKLKMIEAVKAELNRVYRLFVRRNPNFEKRGGRVSLICHSLGSALAADILSEQPTFVPLLDQQSEEALKSNKHLLFNVKNLFFIGSPNGFFFHLEGAQLIARRGTGRTKDVSEDAAREEAGRYGCMAAEAVYNCYNATDPIAFQLSATVDAPYARALNPISIPDAVPALLEALKRPRISLSKLFDPKHPFSKSGSPAYEIETRAVDAPSSRPSSGVNTPKKTGDKEKSSIVMLEVGTEQKQSQPKARLLSNSNAGGEKGESTSPFDLEHLERAERRFRALNPHGCIDFVYDSGGYNQYLDMLSAHISYWQSSSFATFVLLQLFTNYESDATAPTLVPSLQFGNDLKAEDGEGSSREKGDYQDCVSRDTEGDEEDDNDNESEKGKSKMGGILAALSPSAIL